MFNTNEFYWHDSQNPETKAAVEILNQLTKEQQDAVRFYGRSMYDDGYRDGYSEGESDGN